ncbi:DUF3073 domain-containing protein [Propionibacteriaceae bacterium G1746]|uniref:DUF3073 domain-containing protein n=1 Tax=Aestuariimicrobium sp. G57 TaxID=3418485 RepID=UPI003C1FF70D
MGRGRAKAKQTKVARDLKYRTVDTDFASLERELRSSDSSAGGGLYDEPDYSHLAAAYGDDDDDEAGYDDDTAGYDDEDDERR